MKILNAKDKKIVLSKNYNYHFNKNDGVFHRWGKDDLDDPLYAPGPEIADIEISVGSCLGKCSFCYKSNGQLKSEHMSLNVYKKLITNIKTFLTQVALGITDCYANPDFFKILKWTREQGIIPNYTTHGLDVDDYVVEQTKQYCGAVAISIVNKEKSYDAIKKFTNAGMKQVNVHYMLCQETYDNAFKIVDDIKTDSRLKNLNALVFLNLKKKGNAENKFTYLKDQSKFNNLIKYAQDNKVSIGFDSCSCNSYYKYIENHKNYKELSMYAEPCESGLFSSYFNYKGEYFPCSFTEQTKGWEIGIDAINCNNFYKDIWNHRRVVAWRQDLLKSTQKCDCKFKQDCRICPVYPDLVQCRKKDE